MMINQVSNIETKKRKLLKLLSLTNSISLSNILLIPQVKELGQELNIDWNFGIPNVKSKLLKELGLASNKRNIEYGKKKRV